MTNEAIDLIFGKPIDFAYKVQIKNPTVEEIAYNEKFNTYIKLFTTTTREMFAMSRDVDAIELEFPTILSLAKDQQMDFVLGKMFGVDYRGSALIMEALAYWTGLPLEGDEGFKLLSNGKLLHVGSEWIIDDAEWKRFCDKIAQMMCIHKDTEFEPPRPMNSDTKFKVWSGMLKNKIKHAQNHGVTLADKIMILSISMDSYIPISEIKKMPIFVFNKLFDGIGLKEAYEVNTEMIISGNYDNKKIGKKKHWKETFNTK